MLYVLLVVNYWVYLLTVICNLNFCQQVDHEVKVCSQRYYLLQQMRKQGLDGGCLQVVLQSIVISKVGYYMLCQHGAVMLVEKTSVVLTKCCKKRDAMVLLAHYTVLRNV